MAGLNQVEVLNHVKRMLQVLQYQDYRENPGAKPKRWLLKSPPHVGRIEELLEVFPNAQIIHLHRSPSDTMKSFATLGLYAAGAVMHPVPLERAKDIVAMGMEWLENWVAWRRKGEPDRERHFDILSRQLFIDPKVSLFGVLDFLKVPEKVQQFLKKKDSIWAAPRSGKVVHTFGNLGWSEIEFREQYKELIREYEHIVGLGDGITFPSLTNP